MDTASQGTYYLLHYVTYPKLHTTAVILANAGIQFEFKQKPKMDSRFRENDGV
jgi:hypothetical protein